MVDENITNLPDSVCQKCGLGQQECSCRTVFVENAAGQQDNSQPKTSQQIFQVGAHQVGHIVAGRYVIKGVIGVGGMGTVYDASHIVLNNRVALKVLRHELVEEESIMKRFEQEARACAELKHPNLVTVYDCGISEDGEPFIVMEFLEGSLLLDEISGNSLGQVESWRQGRVSLERFFEVFEPVCTGLEYAHKMGVVHRDLKPTNIIVTRTPEGERLPKVVDFGIAKIEDLGGNMQMLTQTGEVFGSPAYMSPEQCQGTTVDARTDVYALGCVMYEALSGKQAFAGHNIMTVLEMQLNSSPRALSELQLKTEIPDSLSAIVMRCLEKDPDLRFQSCLELRQALVSARDNMLGANTFKIGEKKFKFESLTAVLLMMAIALCVFSFSSLMPDEIREKLFVADKASSSSLSESAEKAIAELLLANYAGGHDVLAMSVPVYKKYLKELSDEPESEKLKVALLMRTVYAYKSIWKYEEGFRFYQKHLTEVKQLEDAFKHFEKDSVFGAHLVLFHYYGGYCHKKAGNKEEALKAYSRGIKAGNSFAAPDWVRVIVLLESARLLKGNFVDSNKLNQKERWQLAFKAHDCAHQVQILVEAMDPDLKQEKLFELEEALRWQCYTSWDMGKLHTAEEEIRRAIAVSKSRDDLVRTKENYLTLAALLKAQNKSEQADQNAFKEFERQYNLKRKKS